MKPHLALLALLLLTATACSNELQTCNTDDDCFAGEICGADNRCRKRVATTDMGAADLASTPDSAPDLPDQPDQALTDMSAPDLDLADMSAPDQDTPDPCQGITCSGHGSCKVSGDDGITCQCEPGYLARGTACARADQLVLGAGYGHTCAIKQSTLSCWGDNTYGQRGVSGTANTPKPVLAFTQDADALALGERHTCAIKMGALSCWGDHTHGQLGIGSHNVGESVHFEPVAVEDMDASTAAVSAGARHTCAIKLGALYCWGDDMQGQLGSGRAPSQRQEPQRTPLLISSLATNVTAVAAGGGHTCAIQNGELFCWGDNSGGQLGQDKSDPTITTPTKLDALQDVTAVTAGNAHTCAIAQGRLSCWGDNSHGQLGVADNAATPLTVTPFGMESGVTAVAAGRFHTCAIKSGSLYCWGANDFKQVDDDALPTHGLTRVSHIAASAHVVALATGAYHTCAAIADLTIQCWGDNTSRQLAAGTIMLP